MLGRAASLQAGKKESRWPARGRGSRVGPHSGPDPVFFLGSGPSGLQRPRLDTHGSFGGKQCLSESWGMRKRCVWGGGGGPEEIGLPTMAEFLYLKYNQLKALSGETPVVKRQLTPSGWQGGGRGAGARAKTRTTPYFALVPLSSLPQNSRPLLRRAERPLLHAYAGG